GNYSGSYDVIFKSPDGKEEKTVGLFKQTGNKITGTFLRVTGDSRYLEGTVQGNEFQLSAFIGSSPSYYKGKFESDGTLTGEILSARGSQPFTGVKNKDAALPDAYKLTYLKEGYKTLDFSLPDVNGKKISLKDDKYKNKVVVLTITGSWCPNCIDEAGFIAPWYKENKKRGVEVIALHYERQTDAEYAKKALTNFRNRFGIEYDQVIAGKADKQAVAESLPALNSFVSFPTTIFIDKSGNVAKIHTGYNGPATGKFYDEFVKEFNSEIDELLKK
ncbi:MAG: TlpA family protein disulfide reductase, partial [Pedobacter sp.]